MTSNSHPSIVTLPHEMLRKIYDFDLYLASPCRVLYEYQKKQKHRFAIKIQHWYRCNKIGSSMPILFVTDFLTEPEKFTKWYIIRLYMKFYPREDLRDLPKHIIRGVYGRRGQTLEQQVGVTTAARWKNIQSNYDVFRFLQELDIPDIMKGGW